MSDSNQIVGATLQVDTGNSNANIKEVNKNLTDVKAGLKDTGNQASVTGKQVGESSSSFSNLKEQMSALPGPLGEAGEGVNKLSATLKALLANPVVLVLAAIVAVLTLMYKAFTNTFEGGEKMEQVFAGIKASAQALFDNLGHIASAIVKFFSFDFSGAVDEIKAVGNAVANAYSQMPKLTAQAQELHREQLTQDLAAAKRQKDLAVLREAANDESIPVAKRKAALLELKKVEEDAAKEQIDLAKRTTDNFIAQKTLQKDGALKNQDEINAATIKQIGVETDAANERRRIDKQITLANKTEIAERKAAAEKAAAEAKARRQELVDFTNKLLKIQQDTELAGITDSYEKEKKQLENKIADDKRTNDVAFQDKKITRAQYDQINLALDQEAAVQRAALTTKHNQDVADKEAAFQKDLQGIIGKIKEDGEKNAQDAEKAKLQLDHDQRVADAAKTYKDDAIKFQAIKQALDDELRADQEKLDEKHRLDAAKKKLTVQEQDQKAIIKNQKSTLLQRQTALDAEQVLIQQAFDNKVITEQEYNTKVAELSQERQQLDQVEADNKKKTFDIISQGLNSLADLIGKNTAAGKAAAVAATIISTYEAAWAIFNAASKNPATIPFPAYPYIQAGLAIVAGLENVQKIVSVSTPGASSSASAPSGGAPAAPVAPTQQGTTLDQNSINSIGNATTGRTYVLDADVQNNADRNARLNRAARLGG